MRTSTRILISLLILISQAFAGGSSFFGTNTGVSVDFNLLALPAGMACTRAGTNASFFNSSGVLTTAGANVARFNYTSSPIATGTLLGLLIEPAATNLALQSNAFTTTWFAQNTAVATSAQFTSPDNTNDGWSETSGTGFGAVAQSISLTAVPYVFSAWAKRIVGTAPINFQDAGVSWGGGFVTTTTITRYAGSGTASAGAQNMSVQVNAASGSTNGLFGAQLELGTVATSYIVTAGASATRNADACTIFVPNSVSSLKYIFDDASTQTVAATPGALLTIPTNLNRPNILTIVGIP